MFPTATPNTQRHLQRAHDRHKTPTKTNLDVPMCHIPVNDGVDTKTSVYPLFTVDCSVSWGLMPPMSDIALFIYASLQTFSRDVSIVKSHVPFFFFFMVEMSRQLRMPVRRDSLIGHGLTNLAETIGPTIPLKTLTPDFW